MKNTHLEHPEDSVLLGKESVQNVIKFLRDRNSTLSVKWDGAPAIVFGTNPENGKFFVGTKSVFNKKKIKVNYDHNDISANHTGFVAEILHVALQTLPNLEGIFQGDFIGFGGKNTYRPNTLQYQFPDIIRESFVFACHTSYVGDTLKTVEAKFEVPNCLKNDDVKFLNTNARFSTRSRRAGLLLSAASVLSNLVKYPTGKEGERLQIAVNKCIREGREIDCLSGNLLLLFNLITQAKELLMKGIVSDENVQCFVGDKPTSHEGYVMSNQFGAFKLVNRREFSYYNFTLPKNWK
jgi:hypothetical protein